MYKYTEVMVNQYVLLFSFPLYTSFHRYVNISIFYSNTCHTHFIFQYRILTSGVWQLLCGCLNNDDTSLSNRMLNGESLIHDSGAMVARQMLEASIQI